MSNKPFDLEKALAGEPILLLSNDPPLKAYINKSSLRDDAFIIEFENEDRTVVRRSKKWLKKYGKNLVMWQEPRPRVQLDLPCPIKELNQGEHYYYVDFWIDTISKKVESIVVRGIFENSILDEYRLNQGRCFATESDVQEWLDAMRNARR